MSGQEDRNDGMTTTQRAILSELEKILATLEKIQQSLKATIDLTTPPASTGILDKGAPPMVARNLSEAQATAISDALKLIHTIFGNEKELP
ncbi:MAG: hypothetical protein M1829_001408 [Trizodia sp. TS-e1964]|nr:MAG: hypothetical protein M1829_001408 [Trizodia sp. TS-e1964]